MNADVVRLPPDLIPRSAEEFEAVCRQCNQLRWFWSKWFGVPFPELEERARDVEGLFAAATTDAGRQFALGRARGHALAWMPRELAEEAAEMVRRVAARRRRKRA